MVITDVIPNTNNQTIRDIIFSLNNGSLKGIKGNRKFAWLINKEFKEYTHIFDPDVVEYDFHNFSTTDGLKCYYYMVRYYDGTVYKFITDRTPLT